ncbi:hypothetical protein K1719_046384 [Acacia pycnantha]|nr:hypothetical protein K1719_046384 [Acacia pycnantha]
MAGTDFGINFMAGLAVDIVKGIGQQARYCYQFKEFVKDLSDEQENLKSARDGMQPQLGKDKANSKDPSGDLQLQLKAANELIDKVDKLKGKAEAKESCCHGVCPNLICRYVVGKKVEEKTKATKQLKDELRQKLLSTHRLSLRIGLYGMAGWGKTSLLRKLHKEVEDSKLYKMVFVVVSNPPNYIAIQDSIASLMLDNIELLDCVMQELPKELENLKALKLLQVANCKIKGNPYKVLVTCSHLGELYFVENLLPEMVQIGQNIPEFFHQIGSFKEMQRYHLEIGVSINTSKDDSTFKLISINNFDSSITNETFQALPQTLEVLLLEKVQGDCKSIVPGDLFPIQGECLNKLKEFVLHDSDCTTYLIDTTNDQLHQTRIFFAKLHKLKVEAMRCLEALCYGPPPSSLWKPYTKVQNNHRVHV